MAQLYYWWCFVVVFYLSFTELFIFEGEGRWEGLRAKDILDLLQQKIAILYGKPSHVTRL